GEYRQARDLLTRLVKDHPDVPEYKVDLARTSLNRAFLLVQMNRFPASLQDLDECVGLSETLLRTAPRHSRPMTLYLSGLIDRSVVLLRLSRIPEAEAEWQRVLKLVPPAQQIGSRMRRAAALGRAGLYVHAAADAEEMERDKSLSASRLYDLGCIHAIN